MSGLGRVKSISEREDKLRIDCDYGQWWLNKEEWLALFKLEDLSPLLGKSLYHSGLRLYVTDINQVLAYDGRPSRNTEAVLAALTPNTQGASNA